MRLCVCVWHSRLTSTIDTRSATMCVALGGCPHQHCWTYPRPCLYVPQAFHTIYHTDENVLLGAPTGSGEAGAAGGREQRTRQDCIAHSKGAVHEGPMRRWEW